MSLGKTKPKPEAPPAPPSDVSQSGPYVITAHPSAIPVFITTARTFPSQAQPSWLETASEMAKKPPQGPQRCRNQAVEMSGLQRLCQAEQLPRCAALPCLPAKISKPCLMHFFIFKFFFLLEIQQSLKWSCSELCEAGYRGGHWWMPLKPHSAHTAAWKRLRVLNTLHRKQVTSLSFCTHNHSNDACK